MAKKVGTPARPPVAPVVVPAEDPILEEKKKARKNRRKAHNHMPEAGELNITAMLDMLTIILVFLLKNYNTDPAANLTIGLNPPVSTTELPMAQAITVAITRNDISVDDKRVAELINGQVKPADLTVKDQPLLIGQLRDSLLARVEHHRKIEELGGPRFEGNMLVIGDRTIDYELLSQVLYSAGQAQLANFKFVTLAPQ